MNPEEEILEYPFNNIDGKYLPKPKQTISMLLAEYRSSNTSDSDLAEIISNSLAVLMKSHDLIIVKEKDCIGLTFEKR